MNPRKLHKYNLVLKFILFSFFSFSSIASEPTSPVFKLHLNIEPSSLNIALQKGSGSHYLFSALNRPLYKYDANNNLQPDLLQDCKWQGTKSLVCQLDKNAKWSDGSPIISEDIARTFFYLIDPKNKAPRADLIYSLKNAESIHNGSMPPTELGIKITGKDKLIFLFSKKDPEFTGKLTSLILSPIKNSEFPSIDKATQWITSGPYKIASWEIKKKIRLEKNPYFNGHPQRPPIEFYFINEDNVALQLYEKGELNFLRRLPTAFIDQFKSRKDFVQIPVARFDYIGFGKVLKGQDQLRKALSIGIQYNEWQQLLKALGPPGCYSLPESFYNINPCIPTDINEAQNIIKKIKESKNKNNLDLLNGLVLYFSLQGGDDHRRSMEWLQEQWNKNLNLQIKVQSQENAVFLQNLEKNHPPLFRKGIGLDYLSCYNALQNFLPSSKENFIELDDKILLNQISKLPFINNEKEKKNQCTDILQNLISKNWIIPMGRIHFTLLVQPQWKGWSLNELNVLDVSQLHL